MKDQQYKYEPRSIGKMIFYEVNNPTYPIEIECFSVKNGSMVSLYTKHKDATYHNYAVEESSICGANCKYFTTPSGKIYATLPLFIKNNIEILKIEGKEKRKEHKEVSRFTGGIVGIRGMFGSIKWIISLEPITSFLSINSLEIDGRLTNNKLWIIDGKHTIYHNVTKYYYFNSRHYDSEFDCYIVDANLFTV